jgi:hypothetical protein
MTAQFSSERFYHSFKEFDENRNRKLRTTRKEKLKPAAFNSATRSERR